ncbi:MAG TPA: GNAT family N-acetyltransferase [Solirubrobacterales bacterium]
MPAELIAAAELSTRELAQWRQLAARAVEPNPFFEPDYILPLARGLGRESEVRLLVLRDGDGWSACMPVHLEKRWHRAPIRSLATWRGHPLYGLLGTPLIAPEQPGESLARLLEEIPGSAPGARFGSLELVAGDGPLGEALPALLEERRPRPIRFERYERAVLRRRPEPTYAEETLSSKHRRELRRQGRKLSEKLGGELVVTDRAGDDDAYADFVALETAGGLATHGTTIAAHPGHVAFFTEMCRAFAARGRLQLLALQAGDQTVAMKCNLLAGSAIFFFKIAYDERWSKYSPGILLELEMLKLFHENSDVDFMDSCADANNAMINRLWPDRRELTTHLLPAAGAAGRATRPALATARSLRDFKRERRNR